MSTDVMFDRDSALLKMLRAESAWWAGSEIVRVPLRHDVVVCVEYPRDIRRAEAKKVAGVVSTLAVQK